MSEHLEIHHLKNGLTVVLEPMTAVQSVAFTMLVPAGSVYDPLHKNGTASMFSDLFTRGAGNRDHRELTIFLDQLGLQRQESAGVFHLSLSGATLGRNLPIVIDTYADILRRPHLPEDEFEAVWSGCEQNLRSMEDDPRQKLMVELRKRAFKPPYHQPTEGTMADLSNITIETLKEHYAQCFSPKEMIIGIAGQFNPRQVIDQLHQQLGDWINPHQAKVPEFETPTYPLHIHHESAQTHIGLAYPSLPYNHDKYFEAWATVSILSGGMSSRLFTEVRENRGLCYSIGASLSSLKAEAQVLCYAGTTNERAQETLNVTLEVLHNLKNGIAQAELDRCKAMAKSSLIMQQESTIARSGKIARDFYHLNRIMDMQEIRQRIDKLTTNGLIDFLGEYPIEQFKILTIGPEPLEQTRAV
jgi:predicted Zn-dependent peptidase